MEKRSVNHCCFGKSVGIKYSECVFVALVIQHVKCIGWLVLPVTGHEGPEGE